MYADDAIRFRYSFYRRAEHIDFSAPPYRPKLDVTETKTYNIDGTWGHTRPQERIIVMLPPEFRDYNLPIFSHEALHNLHTDWSEEQVRRAAYNKALAEHAVWSFDYSFHRA